MAIPMLKRAFNSVRRRRTGIWANLLRCMARETGAWAWRIWCMWISVD
ncbi:hypothetical protein KCP76_01745 [Salmonella enterica subsp. enterica serovar Weltevreden]|nr:hypothetical protein KCP76_01745 [Salmonella enterica subsp. enterica serovar Weltevreden]